jgi:large subunit ribosomal protein L40
LNSFSFNVLCSSIRERKTAISAAVEEKRLGLQKQWSKFRMEEKLSDFQLIDKLSMAQNKALQELKLESEELYLEAIQVDINLLPFQTKGPVATPPIDNYESPDGEYIDISKKWD